MTSVVSAEPVGDRIEITLANGATVRVSIEDARKISTDPTAAAAFLRTWSNPRGAR